MYFKEEECINPFETLGPRRDAFGNLVEEKKDEEDTSGSALSQLLGDDNIATEEDKVEEVVEEKPIILDFAGLANDIKYNQENREAILKQRLGVDNSKKFNPPSMEVGEAPKKTTRKKKTDKDADSEEVNEREQVDFYEKRFSKPLNRVQSIIDELDIKKDKMEAEAEEMREISKKARNGAILEYLGKTESNIIDTLKTKLAAVKEEVNINTKISELELKKAKDKADSSGANNTDAIMSKIYANIAGGTSPAQQMQQTNPQVFQGSMSMNDIYDTMVSDDGFFSPQAYASDDSRVDEMISSRYNHLVDSGRIVETEADRNLRYAGRSITMYVYKEDAGPNWRFAAIDNETNQEICDYEKPTVLGNRMNFDVTKMIAYDNVNRYPLVLVPYVDEYEDKRMVSSYGGSGQYAYDIN